MLVCTGIKATRWSERRAGIRADLEQHQCEPITILSPNRILPNTRSALYNCIWTDWKDHLPRVLRYAILLTPTYLKTMKKLPK